MPEPPAPPTLVELLEINGSVEKTLRSMIKKEILLHYKLEEILSMLNGDGSGK